MNIIEEVRRDREDLARVLKKHKGIRKIVEDLYPDSAHFIYELLQNAEDAGATEAHFVLRRDNLVFEHNGRPFEARDIYAITDIGEGTKADDEDKIGRFGVGFKAVFAYSESPHIWSPTFSFKIDELVLPSPISAAKDLGTLTRFGFPFNNSKKPSDVAFEEVAKGLKELADTTLLFLSRLTLVKWEIDGQPSGKVLRVQHSEHHIEVQRQFGAKVTNRSHFLKFERPVVNLERQRVAVAFPLDFQANVPSFEAHKPLAKQMRIVSAVPGRVSVFFPAEKEVSGLRFHLHGPFVPELSRASVKETPANAPIFEQLAALVAASLHRVRDLGLLTSDILEVLPNGRDQIAKRYDAIRSAIIDEMNEQPLTPTYAKSHAPAKNLLQAKASLKSLLSDKDLEFLIDYDEAPRQWAVGATQRNNNADRFLDTLDISAWDVDAFAELLCNKTLPDEDGGKPENITPEQFQDWLHGKSLEWHQELYALLETDHLAAAGYRRRTLTSELSSLRVVRLSNGEYGIAGESFFVTAGVEHHEDLACVDERVYTAGKSKAQKENAKAFLEAIGVRNIGDAEIVEAILKKRYTYESEIPNETTYRKDLVRFVELVDKEPQTASLFCESYIFEGADQWRMPSQIFLDEPFLNTGLAAYYSALGTKADRATLSDGYLKRGVTVKRLSKFAVAVGASKCLEIQHASCRSNPDVSHLVYAAPGNRTQYEVDEDYVIPRLDALLSTPSLELSQLVWATLAVQDDRSWTIARYRTNSSWAFRTAPSQLARVLRDRPWVPQADGKFVRPAEATRDLLPKGFPFDPGWEWLGAIAFGRESTQRSEEESKQRALAKKLGFEDDDSLDRARRFAALPAEEQLRILADREIPFELPDHDPVNPARRAERVAEQAVNAPKRVTEDRSRSVAVNRDAIKQEAGEYLRQQYTNADGQMVCQVCQKRLPFRLDDGSDYFERVEFLSTLKRHHTQNYLALCPNHAAMYQHANGSSPEQLREMVMDLVDNNLPIVLAKQDVAIYFTKTHLADLKVILEADQGDSEDTGDGDLKANNTPDSAKHANRAEQARTAASS